MCDKVLMSDEGGWIVNANKDYFCENHRANEHSCFDEYLKQTNRKSNKNGLGPISQNAQRTILTLECENTGTQLPKQAGQQLQAE